MFIVVLSVLLVCYSSYTAMKRQPLASRGLMIRHFLVTLTAVILTAPAVYRVFYCVTHPQIAFADFYVSNGAVPAWLVFSMRVAGTILGAIVWTQSLSLARREPKGRSVFLLVWPFLVLIWLIESLPNAQEMKARNITAGVLVIYTLFAIVIWGGIGSLIYWHFRSSSSDDLFSSQKAT